MPVMKEEGRSIPNRSPFFVPGFGCTIGCFLKSIVLEIKMVQSEDHIQ